MNLPARASGPRLSGVIAAFAAVYVLWGSTYLAIRFAVETLPPLLLAGTRFLIAGSLMYAFARWRKAPAPKLRDWPAAASVGVLLVAANGGVSWAEKTVPSAMAALMVTTVPLWMVLLNWLRPRGARPSIGQTVGLFMGFFGVVLLIDPFSLAASHESVPAAGGLVLILASLSWAIGSLRARHVKLPASPWISTSMEMLTGGAAVFLAGLLLGEGGRVDVASISWQSLVALGYLITFGSLIGFTCYVWLMKVSTPARVSTYAYVNPVVAVVLGYFLAGETITGWTLLAAGVIVAAVILITSSRPETPAGPAASGDGTRPESIGTPAPTDGRVAPLVLESREKRREALMELALEQQRSFRLGDLIEAQRSADRRYHEFLRNDSMSLGLYRLPAGAVDTQCPHTEDEVYVVLQGRARLRVGDEDHTAVDGTVLFVEAGAEHRFHDITEDLTTLVLFAPPEGSQAATEPLNDRAECLTS